MSQIHSAPYRPAMACERCCFGSGEHAEWCEYLPTYESLKKIDAILAEPDETED